MEFDDLNNKSREADKEVNMVQMKIQEVNNNISKLQKDMECKFILYKKNLLWNVSLSITAKFIVLPDSGSGSAFVTRNLLAWTMYMAIVVFVHICEYVVE